MESNSCGEASPELTMRFREILKSNGISDPVSEIIVCSSGLKGENFGGLTQYVTVNFWNSDIKPLNLFVKKALDAPEFKKLMEEWGAYKKESAFFMRYLPVARDYCKRMGQESLMSVYPKCYFGDESMIVLENLVLGRDFILLKKEELQDFDTAIFALKNLAKHHAISHAVIKELGGPNKFFEMFPEFKIEPVTTTPFREMFSPLFENGVNTNIDILEKCDVDGSQLAIAKLKSLQGKQFDQVLDVLKTTPEDFLVLNHGDYWNNNMMFLKDKGTGKIVDQVAVDFQGLRYASPCVDIGYYLNSVKPKVRRERIRELLNAYLETLNAVGNELGHPINITFEELEADFCTHFHYGYWFGLATTGPGMEIMKDFDDDDIADMGKMLEKWDQLVTKWVEEHPEKCRDMAVGIIEYLKDYDRFTSGRVSS